MFSDDNIIIQLVEEKAELELKCKNLESKLKEKTADENWRSTCQAENIAKVVTKPANRTKGAEIPSTARFHCIPSDGIHA